VRDHEPYLALSGGSDGMNVCRKIAKGAREALASEGWLIFEHHYDQSEKALDLLAKEGFKEIDFYNDLENIRRFAVGKCP